MTKAVRIALDTFFEKCLDYAFLENADLYPGRRVEVPLRSKICTGTIVDIVESPFESLKPIKDVLPAELSLSPMHIALAQWMSGYYLTSLPKALSVMLPPKPKKERLQTFVERAASFEKLIEAATKKRGTAQAQVLDVFLQEKRPLPLTELCEMAQVSKSPVDTLVKEKLLRFSQAKIDPDGLFDARYFPSQKKILHKEQKSALEEIVSDLDAFLFSCRLLFGVTGSGKTEVFLQAIEHCLLQDRSCIYLVPEIGLCGQTIARLKSRFDCPIFVFHSKISATEKATAFCALRRGQKAIVVGARSAIFCPMEKLGLIIVDEEADKSYKQEEEAPTYSAKEVACIRAKLQGACVLFGSATPSLESMYRAKSGKWKLSYLSSRAEKTSLPNVTLVDMKKEYEKNSGYTPFSAALLNAVEDRAKKGEQSLLFLNRRGYFSSKTCTACGETLRCPSCHISLTLHKKSSSEALLACHYCDHSQPSLRVCPQCKALDQFEHKGLGTEQVEKRLKAIFPSLRVMRIDADSTAEKDSAETLLRTFAQGKADVLVGTQMIAKGLHFPQLTLVGILNADASLQIPDFRASEYTFSLLSQVSGRAGRSLLAGDVIIQTLQPHNKTLLLAKNQDFEQFYEHELQSRKLFQFSPFTQMLRLNIASDLESAGEKTAQKLYEILTPLVDKSGTVHPPTPAGLFRVRGRFRFFILVRGPHIAPLSQATVKALQTLQIPKNCAISVIVSPLNCYF